MSIKNILFTFLYLLLVAVFNSCIYPKIHDSKLLNRDDVILNSIQHFPLKNKEFKNFNVFDVSEGELDENVLVVRIGVHLSENPLYYNGDVTKLPSDMFPSKAVEINENLFIWHDENYPMNNKTASLLIKYKVIEVAKKGLPLNNDFFSNDSQKAMHYYYCNNDINSCRKFLTTKAIGTYNPNIKCK